MIIAQRIQRKFFIDYSLYLKETTKYFGSEYEFLIFSDDFNSLRREANLENLTNLENDNELEDLYSLSQCDSVIMSNKFFLWWGLFWGKKSEKLSVQINGMDQGQRTQKIFMRTLVQNKV